MATTWPRLGAGLAEDSAEVLDLGVAADEACQAPEGRRLQARPGLTRPRQLEHLDRLRQALHRHRP